MALDCPSGCNHFYGGEVRHDENCKYYPESLTKMYAQLRTENADLKARLKRACEALRDMKVREGTKGPLLADELEREE